MADGVPLYKFTQLPSTLKTDVQGAYFGAQAQKERRSSILGAAKDQLDTGKINLDSFQQVASRVLGSSVGLPERLKAIDTSTTALNNQVNTEYQSLTDQYNQGQIAYPDYLTRVRELGAKTATNITNNPDYVAPTNSIDNYKIGDYTVGDILKGVTADYRVQQENQKADDYSKGKISFEDYAGFLNNQLNYYTDTTKQDETLKRVWEDAYSTELTRYYNEIVAKHDAGQMTEPEYADFLKWYGDQVNKGPQQTTTFTEFSPVPVTPTLSAEAAARAADQKKYQQKVDDEKKLAKDKKKEDQKKLQMKKEDQLRKKNQKK